MSDSRIFEVIVIGAGPGGLVATKELIEAGITSVLCLEAQHDVGGRFLEAYQSLTLTSSCSFSMFSDYWIGDGKQHHFWSKDEVLAYWRGYAAHFGVAPNIRFDCAVERCSYEVGNGWLVESASGEWFQARRLIIASGNNSHPNVPSWSTGLNGVRWLHASEYQEPSSFAGKNVLVVGGGESAADITLEIAKVAKQTWLSLRTSPGWIVPRKRGAYAADIATHRGVWGLPRRYGKFLSHRIIRHDLQQQHPYNSLAATLNKTVPSDLGVWGIFGTKNYSIPEAVVDYGCQLVGDVVTAAGGTLITADHVELLDVDCVVFCTGYRPGFNFAVDGVSIGEPRSFYKQVFHPELGEQLMWVGAARPCFGSQFPIMEMQSRLIAGVLSGRVELPSAQVREVSIRADAERYKQQLGHSAQRVGILVDYAIYMDDLAKMLGCVPPFWRSFFLQPRIWLRLVYGALQATQYRLVGFGAKPDLARELLLKLPLAPFNHMVKAGLLARLHYLLTLGFLRRESPLN